jgi:thioredoxin 1
MAGENVKHLTDAEFDEYVLKGDVPSLVDFWAPWCGPCKAIGPVIEELADEYAGKVQITKMNVDDNPTTPGKYSIRAIPTLILFKGGEIKKNLRSPSKISRNGKYPPSTHYSRRWSGRFDSGLVCCQGSLASHSG